MLPKGSFFLIPNSFQLQKCHIKFTWPFPFIHAILPNNHRLAQIRIRVSPLCEFCGLEDTNSHRFYHCGMVQESILWLRKVVVYICGLRTTSLLKILYLDLPRIDRRNMNSLCVIISCYISTVWFNRTDLRFIKNIIKASIVKMQKLHRMILGSTMKKVFSENYCNLDMRMLNNLWYFMNWYLFYFQTIFS